MAASYLKKYYLNDNKLAQRALLEFERALATRRMIAFTGSMTTQAFGYGDWTQLRMTFAALAHDLIARRADGMDDAAMAQARAEAQRAIRKYDEACAAGKPGVLVAMSLIEEILDQPLFKSFPTPDLSDDSPWPLDRAASHVDALAVSFARRFRRPRPGWRTDRAAVDRKPHRQSHQAFFNEKYNVPDALWKDLGIRRFATTNYDFELERTAMLADQPVTYKGEFTSPFAQLRELRERRGHDSLSWDLGSGRIRRVLADGWAVESDLLNRDRIDRMIEFAVGTDDVDGHIMHLHGRACNWRSMIVSQRNYDDLYRRHDLNRHPFELGRRMLMGGNPILFVGLGMSEDDLNREMTEFISNSRYQRIAPTFVLWGSGPGQLDDAKREAFRVDFLHRLGVLTIFDVDIGMTPTVRLPEDHKRACWTEVGKQFRSYLETDDKPNPFDARSGKLTIDRFMDDCKNSIQEIDSKFSKFDQFELRNSITHLSTFIKKNNPLNPSSRAGYARGPWRSMQPRIDSSWNADPEQPTLLWAGAESDPPVPPAVKAADELQSAIMQNSMSCIIGSQGCGKGELARALVEQIKTAPETFGLPSPKHAMLINGGFSFDTDSLLDAVMRFLSKTQGRLTPLPHHHATDSRSEIFRAIELDKFASYRARSDAVVIINGMERFFNINGRPLSAELDELLHMIGRTSTTRTQRPRFRWILFGTERVRRYMEDIGAAILPFPSSLEEERLEPSDPVSVPLRYLDEIRLRSTTPITTLDAPLTDAIASYLGNASGRISGEAMPLRRAFSDFIFDAERLAQIIGLNKADEIVLARKILRNLAFIGTPVERAVLEKMPGLAGQNRLAFVLKILVKQHLVLKLKGFSCPQVDGAQTTLGVPPSEEQDDGSNTEAEASDRYTLHRLMLTEMRYRFGIPLNEAKLSTAFNMSLYVAQPIDGDIPDNDIHDELGDAIDRLIGVYKTIDPSIKLEESIRNKLKASKIDFFQHIGFLHKAGGTCIASERQFDSDFVMLTSPDAWSKYLQIHQLCSAEHVQCLRAALALIRGYYSTTGLLTIDGAENTLREGRDGILHEHAERLDDLIDGFGKQALARASLRKFYKNDIVTYERLFGSAEPFYADELVWLHNERGVVRLALGDLYEARRSFDCAMAINRTWVEADDRAHNWRRIRLNQLTVDIEMGDIGQAERKIEEIERVSRQNAQRLGGTLLDEDKLAMAIAKGYHGWCLHLRGQFTEASEDYKGAIKSFSDLKEVRAQAYFRRLQVNTNRQSTKDRIKDILEARELAQSSRQMDIVHRLQIKLAYEYLNSDTTSDHDKQKANRMLDESLVYALQTDVHRVRCEASMTIAFTRYRTGDYDGALRFAMDAIMIATRYGMELRKISLRALIARIMAARGHPVTAEHLARTCIKIAARRRYQTAIDAAEQVLLDIPNIAHAISRSDQSGQRHY